MNNAKDYLKSKLEDYLSSMGINTTKPKFNCLICGSSDGANFVPNSNRTKWKCFSGNHKGKTTGDIFEYVQQLEGIDFKTAFTRLKAMYNISDDYNTHSRTVANNKQTSNADETPIQEKNFIENEIKLCVGACEHTIGFSDYLTKRGISPEVQRRFNIGYFGEWLHPKTKWKYFGKIKREWLTPRIIIPTSECSYLARITTPEPPKKLPNGKPNPEYKYFVKAYKVGNVHIFNSEALINNEGYCYIFEGEIDCLSAIQLGFNAVGLGSTSMIDKLFQEYKINPNNVLIIALDNDDGGKKATQKLITLCRLNKILYYVANPNVLFNGAKDCNEALINNKNALKTSLEQCKKEALKIDKQAYLKELEQEQTQSNQQNNNIVAHHNSNGNNSTSSKDNDLPKWIYLSERGKKRIDEKEYCSYITNKLQIKTIKGKILTIEKELEESELENIVFNEISEHINQDIALRTKKLVSAIKIYSFSHPLKADIKRIHLANGTYNVASKTFENNTYWCINRLNVNYNPNASTPTKWLKYLNELLNNDDIITLQEFLGYCLIPTCKAQIMLFLIGSGGEGKSVIADILRALIGDNNINDDKIHELQNNRFKVANCENKLLNIDDDLNFKALEDTGLIKSVITGANISVEQKGKQAYKIKPYCRLLAFGNGTLNSLYDHTTGFYRRQVIINTKPKPSNRIDNPFLADEIIENELEGILLWLIDGLNRLLNNNFKIFISQASKKAIEDLKSEAFNFMDYLQDSDEVQFNEKYEETSVDIYASYCNWCYNNALKPLKNRSVLTYLKEHAEEYHVQPSHHITKNGKQSRGFKGIRVTKYNQSIVL